MTRHDMTCLDVKWHGMTLHDIALDQLGFVTLHCITLHHITHDTLHYIALYCIATELHTMKKPCHANANAYVNAKPNTHVYVPAHIIHTLKIKQTNSGVRMVSEALPCLSCFSWPQLLRNWKTPDVRRVRSFWGLWSTLLKLGSWLRPRRFLHGSIAAPQRLRTAALAVTPIDMSNVYTRIYRIDVHIYIYTCIYNMI